MAKRSPILGYNHNVRYRGLIFHVQTEDSGMQSPHLFTHLFHGGVIISTRKLVYDAGSAEDSIKSLMQAQHKAVLKDLRRGAFDDKMDEYLAGTAGLLPRGATGDEEDRPSAVELTPTPVPVTSAELSIPTDPASAEPAADGEGPALGRNPLGSPRTQTADRRSGPSRPNTQRPPRGEDAPTLTDETTATVAAAIAAANATVKTPMADDADSSPEIEIQLELDEPDELPVRTRSPRDTDVAVVPLDLPDDHTRPTIDISSLSDGVPGAVGIAPATAPTPERRPNAVGAATLPPARPISRPPSRPAIIAPQVVSRPLPPDERGHRESDAIEVYAPAPPGADAPPGAPNERPGQYSQHRVSQRIPMDLLKDRSGPSAIPPGLGRPGRPSSAPATGPVPAAKPVGRESSAVPPPIPQSRGTEPSPVPPVRSRTTTPARIAGRSGGANSSGGVVMTRPAVIVGAPPKPPTTQRIRKAREDEGRGFGQGLISEKSLDEVILAYLSEDADDK